MPSVSTGASAQFEALINRNETAVDWELTYEGLESKATQAHIHFGQRGVNGGISIWLCSNLPSPPTPPNFSRACPLREGSISGTAMASDVVGPAGQLIKAGRARGDYRRDPRRPRLREHSYRRCSDRRGARPVPAASASRIE